MTIVKSLLSKGDKLKPYCKIISHCDKKKNYVTLHTNLFFFGKFIFEENWVLKMSLPLLTRALFICENNSMTLAN
jgi:hypothetical protein